MLEFAKLHEEELRNIAYKVLLDPKYDYYNLGYFSIPEIPDNDWNYIKRVSYKYRVLGYFSAGVDRNNGIISSLAVWSCASDYKEYKEFEKDLLDFWLHISNFFSSIHFSVVIGNPVQKKYRQFIKAVGGNIVGVTHKTALIKGELRDEELYEVIVTPETKDRIKKLRERFKYGSRRKSKSI